MRYRAHRISTSYRVKIKLAEIYKSGRVLRRLIRIPWFTSLYFYSSGRKRLRPPAIIMTSAFVTTPGSISFLSKPTRTSRSPIRPVYNHSYRACAAALPNAVKFTAFGNNTFVLEDNSTRYLIDPFLEDDLVFFVPAFFRLIKQSNLRGIGRVGNFDAVVLTQYLPDHAHEPTLKKLPKNTPVVAPPQAEPMLKALGFSDITILVPGDPSSSYGGKITAEKGSIVGPPGSDPQNALVFRFGNLRVYHEPHGVHDTNFVRENRGGKIDAAIAPVVSAEISTPLFKYNLVNGYESAIEFAKKLQPKTLVGFDNSGGEMSGFLTKVIAGKDGRPEMRDAFRTDKALQGIKLVLPEQATPCVIAAEEAVAAVKRRAV